ncbi:MAG TPA: glycosyltransferase family 2 protein [Anaerolineae bacterium]
MQRLRNLADLASTSPGLTPGADRGPYLDGGELSYGEARPSRFADTHSWKVVAVIPAYREDRFIGSVVFKTRPLVDHVIVVDDGSPDQTAEVARAAGADVIVHEVNQGKARALATGFAHALALGADIVVILDGDGQHNPNEIPLVIAPIQEGVADMVIGSRFQGTKSKIPVWRQFGQHGLTFVTNVASGVSSTDSQSGFRAFRREALSTFNISAHGFSVESEMQFWAREQELRVAEAPISVIYAEKPKRSPVTQGLQVLNGVLQLVSQMRPLLFFGVSGLLVVLLGLGFWYNILRTFDLTRQFALGHALLATLFITIGMLAAFEGVTLHILRQIVNERSGRPLRHVPIRPAEERPSARPVARRAGHLSAIRVASGAARPRRRRV